MSWNLTSVNRKSSLVWPFGLWYCGGSKETKFPLPSLLKSCNFGGSFPTNAWFPKKWLICIILLNLPQSHLYIPLREFLLILNETPVLKGLYVSFLFHLAWFLARSGWWCCHLPGVSAIVASKIQECRLYHLSSTTFSGKSGCNCNSLRQSESDLAC